MLLRSAEVKPLFYRFVQPPCWTLFFLFFFSFFLYTFELQGRSSWTWVWFKDVLEKPSKKGHSNWVSVGPRLRNDDYCSSLPRLTRPCRGIREACFANGLAPYVRTRYLPVPLGLIYIYHFKHAMTAITDRCLQDQKGGGGP